MLCHVPSDEMLGVLEVEGMPEFSEHRHAFLKLVPDSNASLYVRKLHAPYHVEQGVLLKAAKHFYPWLGNGKDFRASNVLGGNQTWGQGFRAERAPAPDKAWHVFRCYRGNHKIKTSANQPLAFGSFLPPFDIEILLSDETNACWRCGILCPIFESNCTTIGELKETDLFREVRIQQVH
jgi:hypothetical protein